MNGTILNFDKSAGTGILRGDDGMRYRFLSSDWSSDGAAQTGDVVDFEIDGANAADIFVLKRALPETQPASPVALPPKVEPVLFVQAEPSADINAGAALRSETVATQSTPDVPAMPSGKNALFFVGYLLTMIPTYILPYFGSNSVVLNGIGKVAGGGMPVQFWWHLTCYAVLMFLAYARGIQIARGWLITLPLVAMVFEFMPGLNYIPLVPTVINLAALFIGTTRSAPIGFAPGNLNRKTQWSLWCLAAFCALVLISLFTSNMTLGNPFAATLFIWPVFGAAIYFALQYQAKDVPAPDLPGPSEENSAALAFDQIPDALTSHSTDEIPTEDQAVATPAPDDGTPATTSGIAPWLQTLQGRIVAGATILVVAGGIALFASQNKRAEYGTAMDEAAAAGADATNPAITGQETTLYIIADANLRDRATAQGSTLLSKLPRGTALTGTMEIGADQTSTWFKLADGRGYIGGVNLSPKQPPALAKTFTDMKWNVETGTDLLELPAQGSAIVARLNYGDQTTIAGVTTNGYAEVKRSRGGVGYFLVTGGNDRNGTLAVNASQDAGTSVMVGEKRLVTDVLNLDTVGMTEYVGQIGDQITTLKFETDANKQLLFGDATYRNAVTKSVCNTMMQFKNINANSGFELSQGITKMGPSCRHHAAMFVTPIPSVTPGMPPETLQISWMLGSQKLMGGKLDILGTD
jgi:uncharacterized membrane protein (GlpM family)